MKIAFGTLFLIVGLAAMVYGFAVTAPPIGAALNQIGTDMASAYSEYQAEHPIATGIGLIITGFVFVGVAGILLQKKGGEPQPSSGSL